MNEAGTFGFIAPGWLILLPALWWLIWRYARDDRRQSMWNRLCDPQLLEAMRGEDDKRPVKRWLTWLLTCLLTLGTVAAAGPGWRQQDLPVMESATARVIALDLSRAMLVEDVKPNRYTQAIAAAREMLNTAFEGETGLVVFSGAAFVVSPLSRDVNTLLAFLEALEPDILPLDGSRLALAIHASQKLLSASVTGRGQILIITAGAGDNEAALRAASAAGSRGQPVSIMAIGTAAGGPLIGADGSLIRDERGGFVLAKTDFASLERIARAGKGVIASLDSASAYDELLGARIEAGKLVESETGAGDDSRNAINDGIWLVWLMLPLALLLFRRNLVWLILLTAGLPLDDGPSAADRETIWQHREQIAFEAYHRGDFQRSSEISRDPMLAGSAHYRRGHYAQALEFFSQNNSARAHYNRGNALARLDRHADAINAYAQALALDPALGDARYNKRLIEIYLERQQSGKNDPGSEYSDDGDGLDSLEQTTASEGRLGIVAQDINNPGDQPELGPGSGASIQSGIVDPFEQFDGREQQARFSLGENISQSRAQNLLDHWIRGLPTTSSDLFRRKFLRDYQRQKEQSR